MAVDRLSVTVPDRLGRELRALAKARGANVSAVVTEAIEREVRMAALERALHEADERFGPVDDGLVRRAEGQLAAPTRRAKRTRRRTTR